MRVKAIRKGFFLKIRHAGERFEMPVNACPSWCIELDKVKTAKAKDLKVVDVDAYMATLKTAKDVDAFVGDDERVGTLKAAEQRKEQILAEED